MTKSRTDRHTQPAIVRLLAFLVGGSMTTGALGCRTGGGGDATSNAPPASPTPEPTGTPDAASPMRVRFLGVGGFQLTVGDDELLTAPLFTNPSMLDVTLGVVKTDPVRVDTFLGDVSRSKAILSGHAHYDHLMDVPYVWTETAGAFVYTNRSGRHLLAGFAPDPAPGCEPSGEPWWAELPREHVVALDDPTDDVVDYRMCPSLPPCVGARQGEGRWVEIPDSHMRVRALCSSHPDQFAGIHFGEGCVEEDPCSPPTDAPDWKEGLTLAFLIDFLDPETGSPAFRVYYQDAPAEAPVSHPHPELLTEKAVDLAIVNGGNYEAVAGHPAGILAALEPRYAVVGHWEDFFRPQDEPIEPLPFLDKEEIRARLADALPGEPPRYWIPDPGTELTFSRE